MAHGEVRCRDVLPGRPLGGTEVEAPVPAGWVVGGVFGKAPRDGEQGAGGERGEQGIIGEGQHADRAAAVGHLQGPAADVEAVFDHHKLDPVAAVADHLPEHGVFAFAQERGFPHGVPLVEHQRRGPINLEERLQQRSPGARAVESGAQPGGACQGEDRLVGEDLGGTGDVAARQSGVAAIACQPQLRRDVFGNGEGDLGIGSNEARRWAERGYIQGDPAGFSKLPHDLVGAVGEPVLNQPRPLHDPLPVPVPPAPTPAGRLGDHGPLDLVGDAAVACDGGIGSEGAGELCVGPVGEAHPEVGMALRAQVGEGVGRADLVEDVDGPVVVQADVGVGGVEDEFSRTHAGLCRSGGHPILIGAPVPVVAGVEAEHHVVEVVVDIDVLGERGIVGGVGHSRSPCAAIPVDRPAAVDRLIVVFLSSEILRQEAGIESLANMVEAGVFAVDVEVGVATVGHKMAHLQLCFVHPSIARILSGLAEVEHRVVASGAEGEGVVRLGGRHAGVEFGVQVEFQFWGAVFAAEAQPDVVLVVAQAVSADIAGPAAHLEVFAVGVHPLHRHGLLGGGELCGGDQRDAGKLPQGLRDDRPVDCIFDDAGAHDRVLHRIEREEVGVGDGGGLGAVLADLHRADVCGGFDGQRAGERGGRWGLVEAVQDGSACIRGDFQGEGRLKETPGFAEDRCSRGRCAQDREQEHGSSMVDFNGRMGHIWDRQTHGRGTG